MIQRVRSAASREFAGTGAGQGARWRVTDWLMRRLTNPLFCLSLLALPLMGLAEVVPHSLFSDHAVLQRGAPVPVWGTAAPGESVTVEFRGGTARTTADAEGKWIVRIDPGAAGGPFEMVLSGSNTVRLRDVLVGEVWLCSGQSNMERQLGPRSGQKPIINAQAAAAAANYPRMRQFMVPDLIAYEPQADVEGAAWVPCSPTTVQEFTAVGFFFGRDLQAALEVPIGLVESTWGGTPAEAWTSEEAVSEFPSFAAMLELMSAYQADPEGTEARYLASLEDWFVGRDEGSAGLAWAAPGYQPDDAWVEMDLPVMWEDAGYAGFDGIGWFRREFELPPDWDGEELLLQLSAIDDIDTTWVNGRTVGSMSTWDAERAYRVAADLLHAGRNVIAVRVLDTGGGGGIWDPKVPLQLSLVSRPAEVLDLRGAWRFRPSTKLSETGRPPQLAGRGPGAPSVLFNGMIAPLIPYAMKGVIWYQGEANASDPILYRELFPSLIADWRSRWGLGDFPFLFVQIAPFEGQPPEIREAQLFTLARTANTAMAVTIDVGDAEDIHPANKEPVGERLALAARALAYGEDLVYSGPLFDHADFEGDRAIVHFTHVEPGLVAVFGALEGFTLAGADGVLHLAEAVIDGDTVVVTSPAVPAPVAVRYGWAHVAAGNLFNRAGLPASPFRSDVN